VYHAKSQKQGHEAVLEEPLSWVFTDGWLRRRGIFKEIYKELAFEGAPIKRDADQKGRLRKGK